MTKVRAGFLLTGSREKVKDMDAQDTRKSGVTDDFHGSLSDVEDLAASDAHTGEAASSDGEGTEYARSILSDGVHILPCVFILRPERTISEPPMLTDDHFLKRNIPSDIRPKKLFPEDAGKQKMFRDLEKETKVLSLYRQWACKNQDFSMKSGIRHKIASKRVSVESWCSICRTCNAK